MNTPGATRRYLVQQSELWTFWPGTSDSSCCGHCADGQSQCCREPKDGDGGGGGGGRRQSRSCCTVRTCRAPPAQLLSPEEASKKHAELSHRIVEGVEACSVARGCEDPARSPGDPFHHSLGPAGPSLESAGHPFHNKLLWDADSSFERVGALVVLSGGLLKPHAAAC